MKPSDPDMVSDHATRFLGVLDRFPRVAIAGGPRIGKSVLSRSTTDRRLFTAREFETPGRMTDESESEYRERKRRDWDEVPLRMIDATKGVDRFVIEGVMVARYLRKHRRLHGADPVDAVVWLSEPKLPRIPGQESMAKGVLKIFKDWLACSPEAEVFYFEPLQ